MATIAIKDLLRLQCVHCSGVQQENIQGKLENSDEWAKEPEYKFNQKLKTKLERQSNRFGDVLHLFKNAVGLTGGRSCVGHETKVS